MNNKIFIEYENVLLSNLCKTLYDLFLENNYDVTLLDNTISFNEKEKLIKESNKKNIVISNKVNDNNTFEIVYSLRNNNELAISLNNSLENVSKYYQRRNNTITSEDYYPILRDINNNLSIIIFYPSNSLNNLNIASNVYRGINNYLKEQNIYTVKSGDTIYSIARNFNVSVTSLRNLNNLSTDNLSIGQKLFIPEKEIDNSSPSTPSNDSYIVKSGDSLYAIARKYNITVDEIKRLNNLTSNNLSIGQMLFIPTTSSPSNENIYLVKSGDSLYAIARKFNTSVDEIKRLNNLTSNNLSINQRLIIPSSSTQNIYTVKSGDSLYAIARTFNTTVNDIKRLNNLTSNNLSIGQKLIIS